MNALIDNLQPHWQQARQQWQANPRLQWGAWLIIIILLFWVNLLCQEQRQQLSEQLQELSWQQQDQQSLLQGESWQQRLTQARAANKALDKYFGMAPNEALARAEVQSRVSALFTRFAVGQPQVEVSKSPQQLDQNGLIPLQLRVTGRTNGDGVIGLVNELEKHSPRLIVNALTVNNQMNDKLNFTLQATVWYHPFGEKKERISNGP
ncbi:GspMb/PilO family protein [Aeromonas veronii]|uniref:GspMb/PilO family protein n=1 Tax=Aeromonas veronii TaxID=654 RepID=UPI00191EE96E|nr:GspMb/PilO family protein [Aeromonas veronii]MBL0504639.1 hypothetical protein [Aeromonas veronii]HDX8348243.1 hypothetical protein [Aeromonas veronii]